MNCARVLDLLNEGKIDELKASLKDEIFTESLKKKPDAKKRYSAMKKYFTYHNSGREALQKPCEIEFEGDKYISFCNSYSLAFTTESCGEIELFDQPDIYPDVARLVRLDGSARQVNIDKVIAEAKSLGYKLKKSEVGFDYRYVMKYDGGYYKIGLIDSTYGIINNGGEATVYHVDGDGHKPLFIKNDIGLCLIMPIKFEDDGTKIIIEVL